MLDNINKYITEHTKVNQWNTSASVIEWFKAIKKKQQIHIYCFRH